MGFRSGAKDRNLARPDPSGTQVQLNRARLYGQLQSDLTPDDTIEPRKFVRDPELCSFNEWINARLEALNA